jgi:ATP-dependent Clp protease ATP-binding subunit ClpC
VDYLLALTLLGVAAGAYWLGLRQAAARRSEQPAAPTPPAPSEAKHPVLELAARVPLEGGHPRRLLQDPAFLAAVRMTVSSRDTSLELARLADSSGNNAALACIALEALRERGPDEQAGMRLLGEAGRVRADLLYFYLRALPVLLPGLPLVGPVLLGVAETWSADAIRAVAVLHEVLREFVAERVATGEAPILDEAAHRRLNQVVAKDLALLVDRVNHPALASIAEAAQGWRDGRIDTEFLSTVGRLWTEEHGRAAVASIVQYPALEPAVAELVGSLDGSPPRSVLLLGEAGAGKSTLARLALRRMQQSGWTVFECGSIDLIAGQVYIGQLEERLTRLLREIEARRRVIWYVPDFANLAWAGRHQYSRSGAADQLLPHIERGEIVVLGESQPGPFAELTRMLPAATQALRIARLSPVDPPTALELARARVADQAKALGAAEPLVDEALLREAWQLADQYLRDRVAPGNLLRLLDVALERQLRAAGAERSAVRPLALDDLILTLSTLTGLPANILDEREVIDLAELRSFFDSRVRGQPEAVDCLVERVAMIKAGVTDPTRPAGVFLFAGPTGTGKTEIAKTLAEYLFGSEQRLIRLDMSELQTPESLSRILGEPGVTIGPDRSLTESVRKQPFSVVLLDEFEKAHSNVWDLFLQVFDDGRLTDRRGVVADFRHSIVILTSNLGARIPTGASLGFGGADGAFRVAAVTREIDRAFRREFINRLDRIVVFRPLSRETMREILRREIDLALARRGLRNRSWAVEWEQAALDFLLEQGFTADLGARPLKRAVERHFLAPLARTIVNHQVPRGDQFLFVRSDGSKLDVAFIDPDAPPAIEMSEETLARTAGTGTGTELLLATIVLRPQGTTAELDVLEQRMAEIAERVECESWRERKAAGMQRMSEGGFWESASRFAVLGEVEYLDRIEAGLDSCRSLLARLKRPRRTPTAGYPADLVGSLAQQLYLLEVGCMDVLERRPKDAFVEVDAAFGGGGTAEERGAFARRVAAMYRAWAARRRMQIETLEEDGHDGSKSYRLLLAVSGYGAHTILAPEEGLHVHETPEDRGGHAFRKSVVHVRVAAQPDEPARVPGGRDPRSALRVQALAALASRNRDGLGIVRRYRDLPSPLVRDDVRGFRTGLLDAVLAGNFDVM